MSTGGGRIGSGVGFDFWSPPNFEEEMAKARKKVEKTERDFQATKNTNHGHGVICNTDGAWFICTHGKIDACNEAHRNLCRYAKREERLELEQTIVF